MHQNTKVKVLHLIKSLGRGGAEKLIPETAKMHDKTRFEFHCIYFFHPPENIKEELKEAGVHVKHFPSGNLGLFFQIQRVRNYIRTHEIDLIHSHLPWAGILARFVGNDTSIPIVYTEHNTWERYNKLSYWGNRLTFKKQNVAIAVSNEVALSMRLSMLFNPIRPHKDFYVKTIQNGVNTLQFQRCNDARAEIRKSLGISSDTYVVGKVAVFRSQKRLWLWINVALEILEKAPNTHFMLVGDGDWKDKILNQIQLSGKASNFHWVGVQKNVIPYLSAMDIYMSSSEFEGLPIAMLEAMSCGLPVVATSAGGIAEVIQDGIEGYLCSVEAWKQLAPLTLQLLQNEEQYRSFAFAARKRVKEEFSMHTMVQQLEAVYHKVLTKSFDHAV